MKIICINFLLFIASVLTNYAFAQTESTIKILTLDEFLTEVKASHPEAARADLLTEEARFNLMKARGGFDPLIESALTRKFFDDKLYYNFSESSINIPLSVGGVELKAGYETADGIFLNPQRFLPDQQLWFAGISAPVGRGLLFDQKRANLKAAKIKVKANEIEKGTLLINLLYNAETAYWKWYSNAEKLEILEEGLSLAQQRYADVKQTFRFGDIPAADTLEAKIQVQNRRLDYENALLNLKNSFLQLTNFLTGQNYNNLSDTEVAPEKPQLTDPQKITGLLTIEGLINNLPGSSLELLAYDYKLQQLKVDKRLRAENLKPKLNLNYNPLSSPVNNTPFGYTFSNYKLGLEFGMPLLLRKERGELQLAEIRIKDTEYALQFKNIELINKLKAYYNTLNTLKDQIVLAEQNAEDFRRLAEAERRLFEFGESSLFLVNSREVSYLNAALKPIELKAIYQQIAAAFRQAAAGVLPDNK